MDETIQTMPEATAPQGNDDMAARNDVPADGTAPEESPAEPEMDTGAVGADNGEDTASTTSGDTDPNEAPEATVTYQFNHERTTIPVSKAPEVIQKTMQQVKRLEALLPDMDRLRFLAQARGKDLPGLVDELEQSFETRERQALIDQCGGNEEAANRLFELQKKERTAGFKTFSDQMAEEDAQQREQLTTRIGEQLAELQSEFPEITELAKLPESVVSDAADKGISLLDAYLRWQYRNGKRAAAAEKQQAAAREASVGSVKSGADPATLMDASSRSFITAFKNAMSSR